MSLLVFAVVAHAAAASCGCVWEKIRAVEAAREAKDSAALWKALQKATRTTVK